MSKLIGPTRLILINCGKFDYAEVDLDMPLHLVGPNNIGKTSLIAVLQFLYIDNLNKMHFSRDIATSKKYYFPDVHSYALFESLSPEGFKVMGVHGLGPVRLHEIERFVYNDRLSRDHFIAADNSIRPWDQIKSSLASKSFMHLKPMELRAALMGYEGNRKRAENNSVNLSLVPLNRRDEYDRFCKVFLNLLRLSHLNQDELKDLLLQLFEGKFTKKKVDLQEQFEPQLKQLQQQKVEVQDLKRNEHLIRKLLETFAKRDDLRGQLCLIYNRIKKAFSSYKDEMNLTIEGYNNQIGACQVQLSDNYSTLGTLRSQLTEKNKRTGVLEDQIKQIKELEERFSDFQINFETARILELETKVRSVEASLTAAGQEHPDVFERQLKENQAKFEQLTTQLKNINSQLVTVLLKLFDKGQVEELARLFNHDVLKLSIGGDASPADIINEDALQRHLDYVSEHIKELVYSDIAVRLDLNGIAFDPDEFKNPDRIRERIRSHERIISETKKALDAARNNQELTTQCAAMKEELDDIRSKCAQYQEYVNKKTLLPSLRAQLEELESETASLNKAIAEGDEKNRELDEKVSELKRSRQNLQNNIADIENKIKGLPMPDDEWPDACQDVRKLTLADMIEYYSRRYSDQESLAKQIDTELGLLHDQTYSRYQAQNERESLELFRNELETLDEKQKALEENWLSFTVQLKKDFKELSRDMEKLHAEVNKLNSQFEKVQISNLLNLKIIVEPRPDMRQYFAQVETSEDAPLFADPGRTDEVMRKISTILQKRPVITLDNLFDMHFEITSPNGDTKTYDHLDRIESNGTTITIKVLINLILLRGLLAHETVYIPFYLDECSSLDCTNLRSIVQIAKKLGFIAVLASPEAMDAAHHLYYLNEHKGRVVLNRQNSLVEIVRESDGDSE